MTRAMRSLITDQGQSTYSLRAWPPLRTRASKSAIGSVIDMQEPSPARLGQARNHAFARQVAQAEPAHAKTAVKGARPAAQRAAVVTAHFEFRRPNRFDAQ